MKNNQDLFEQKSKNNLLKIFLSSFLTISFFYITPIFINFADKNFYTKEYTNNSKKIEEPFLILLTKAITQLQNKIGSKKNINNMV